MFRLNNFFKSKRTSFLKLLKIRRIKNSKNEKFEECVNDLLNEEARLKKEYVKLFFISPYLSWLQLSMASSWYLIDSNLAAALGHIIQIGLGAGVVFRTVTL